MTNSLETYAGQEEGLACKQNEMTPKLMKAFQLACRHKVEVEETIPTELIESIRPLAEHGSHIARNMLHLLGYTDAEYNGVLFEYKTELSVVADYTNLSHHYEPIKEMNES
ncbi:hypothetical protein BH10PAT3_BH10PAT3_4740 [soil metagenome]